MAIEKSPMYAIASKLIVTALVATTGYIWVQNDGKIDDLKKADSAQVVKIDTNTAAIGELGETVARIEEKQDALKDNVDKLGEKMETSRKEQREDMKELLKAIRATNGSPP